MPQIGALTDINPITGQKGIWYLASWDGQWHGLTVAQFPDVAHNPQNTYLARLGTSWSAAMNSSSEVRRPCAEVGCSDPGFVVEPFCRIDAATNEYVAQMLDFHIVVTSAVPLTYTYSVDSGAGG
jgi:hypothetical protein